MKRWLLLVSFLVPVLASATEKIWIPLGTPEVTPQSTPTVSPTLGTGAPEASVTPTPIVPGDDYWTSFYPSGTPESEGSHVSGLKEGVWKFYRPDGSECREMEYKKDSPTGNLVLFDEDGGQKFFKNFADLVQKGLPDGFQMKTFLPYLVDLSGSGDMGIVALVRSGNESVLMVLDTKGQVLDSKQTTGLADDLIFGRVGKGMPLCFGFDSGCDTGVGTCNWEFDICEGGKLKTVLQYNGWYGKAGPFTLPVFKDVDGNGQNGIVTDNGTFKWNAAKGDFERK